MSLFDSTQVSDATDLQLVLCPHCLLVHSHVAGAVHVTTVYPESIDFFF